MANLSNINGKFVVEQTTGYVGVGTTDPSYPIEVLNASAEIALNASGGSIYRVQSDSASNFIIRKEGVGNRLVINSGGDATFSGEISSGDDINCPTKIVIGESAKAELRLKKTATGRAGVFFYMPSNTETSYIELDASEDMVYYGYAGVDHKFYAGTSLNLTLSGTDATFEGKVGIGVSPGAQLHNYSTAATNVFITGHGTAAQNNWGAQNCMFVKTDNGLLISKANAANNTNRLFNFYNDANGYAQLYMYTGGSIPQVQIKTSGDSYFNGGNVGIGATSPGAKLEIAQTGGTQLRIVSGDASGSQDVIVDLVSAFDYRGRGILYRNSNDSNKWFSGVPYNGGGYSIGYHTSQPEYKANSKLFVASSGDVGIGTTSPPVKLSINGWSYNPGAAANAGMVGLKQGNASSYGYVVEASANDKWMMMGHNGTNGVIETTYAASAGHSNLEIKTGSSNYLILQSTGGNVGIGYTSPNAKLDIYSTATFNSRTSGINVHRPGSYGQYGSFSYNSDTTYFSSTYSGGGAGFYGSFVFEQFNNGSVGREAMRIITNGNIGIGVTSPAGKLTVEGPIGTAAYNKSNGGIKNERMQMAWYTGQFYGNNTAYTHIKTNLWMGGAPSGNTQYIMGGFIAKSYGYGGGAGYGEGRCMFHNWSGSFASLYVSNVGDWATFMQSPYVSSDGYCVIVLRHNYYSTPQIDFFQEFTAYPWRAVSVTAQGQSSSNTGLY